MKRVLSGDIGGTSTRLQVTEFSASGEINILARENYHSSDSPDLTSLIVKFLTQIQVDSTSLYSACLAVAGPVVEGKIKFTNLPWQLDENELKQALKLPKVKLINDFQAIGYGIETLADKDQLTLQKGDYKPNGPRALIGAGTGLGMGLMFHNGQYYEVFPTEGGHVDFAPTTDAQIALLNYLKSKLHRVSVERIVSGMGLVNIYRFVCDHPLYGEEENAVLRYRMHKGEDVAALVSEFATQQRDAMSLRALKIFCNVYGATAGNLALTSLPTGGLYVVGGIAPKIIEHLKNSQFMHFFSDKGRMSKLLKTIPVHVVLDPQIGLQGAANFAVSRL